LKVFDESDSVKKELEESMKDRTALRAKHYYQLEEKKSNLDELKTKIQNQFSPNNLVEIEKGQTDTNEALEQGMLLGVWMSYLFLGYKYKFSKVLRQELSSDALQVRRSPVYTKQNRYEPACSSQL
jgi:hypothetical protein